jgi:hypothetical protein
MKNIELSEKQNENLLEMCKILFPELSITIEEVNVDGLGFDGILSIFSKYPKFICENIHWFEFCCNILVNKLFDNSFDFGKIYYELLSSNHPIDYLYEKFKEYEKK